MLSRQVSQGPPGNWEGNVQAVIEKSETHTHTHTSSHSVAGQGQSCAGSLLSPVTVLGSHAWEQCQQ